MHSFLTRSVAAGLLIAAPALAQPAWLPFGTQIAIPSTTSVNTVNLGFNFTMPGGNVRWISASRRAASAATVRELPPVIISTVPTTTARPFAVAGPVRS